MLILQLLLLKGKCSLRGEDTYGIVTLFFSG